MSTDDWRSAVDFGCGFSVTPLTFPASPESKARSRAVVQDSELSTSGEGSEADSETSENIDLDDQCDNVRRTRNSVRAAFEENEADGGRGRSEGHINVDGNHEARVAEPKLHQPVNNMQDNDAIDDDIPSSKPQDNDTQDCGGVHGNDAQDYNVIEVGEVTCLMLDNESSIDEVIPKRTTTQRTPFNNVITKQNERAPGDGYSLVAETVPRPGACITSHTADDVIPMVKPTATLKHIELVPANVENQDSDDDPALQLALKESQRTMEEDYRRRNAKEVEYWNQVVFSKGTQHSAGDRTSISKDKRPVRAVDPSRVTASSSVTEAWPTLGSSPLHARGERDRESIPSPLHPKAKRLSANLQAPLHSSASNQRELIQRKRLSGSPSSVPASAISVHEPSDVAPKSPMNLSVADAERPRRPSQTGVKLNIREASRNRAGSTNDRSDQACESCYKLGPGRWYCNVCAIILCDDCWTTQIVHRRQRLGPGDLPHEKTAYDIAKKIRLVLTPVLTDREREDMHAEDIDTTWFGVIPEDGLPLFCDYGRFANIIASVRDYGLAPSTPLSSGSSLAEDLYPSLISFVGETGAGKSTIIKLLIDLGKEEGENFPTPIVGAAGKDVPTSEDVHLYLDPSSIDGQVPLLFADCEGLEGGVRDPLGAKIKRMKQKQSPGPAGSGRHPDRPKHISERELIWADSPTKRGREFAVAHLYPRLLYTFSDTIVFVLKNPRKIEGVLVRLVEWAAAALESSSNQPVLPHVIIVLNASENNISQHLWDVDTATQDLLDSLAKTVFQNHLFHRYADFWRQRHRQVSTVLELLLNYYSSVRVVRIPTIGRPNLIQAQVNKLSEMIQWASKDAREQKVELRMLLDANEFQSYLQNAFDHFAKTLDAPFDFVQASFANSPIPMDFGGNILKMAVLIMECWGDLPRGQSIFDELGVLVASCIMLDAARKKIRGTDDVIFPRHIEHIDTALENFCDRHWPCEFFSPGGGRCVNVRSGHGAKGHQAKSGKLLEAGDYESRFNFENYGEALVNNIYLTLVTLRKEVKKVQKQEGVTEERAAAKVHRERVLPNFVDHASRGDREAIMSNTVCICCLFEAPEHALPCGHILCTPCLRTYGSTNRVHYVEIPECPMEKRARRFSPAWKVYLKPPMCGVRVLTLDGGGVRGIVLLEVLAQIEKELGGGLDIRSFFDLVVGTSAGGIVALGLTARSWNVAQVTEVFQALSRQSFKYRRGMGVYGLGWAVENYHHSKYETRPLQKALIEAFGDQEYLFGGQRINPLSMDVKVAVTATSAAGTGVVLANYNRLCTDKLPYHFQRAEKLEGELKIFEAARATSAAPTYFKPFCHEPSKQVYSDGGIYYNNPIHIADREWKLLWPNAPSKEADVMVSIGTGYCQKIKEKRSARFTTTRKGIVAHGQFLKNMARDHLNKSLNSEETWDQFIAVKQPSRDDRGRYVRINPQLAEAPPKLDDVDRMDSLQKEAYWKIRDDPMIKSLARRLIATCFYFEPSEEPTGHLQFGTLQVEGRICCRFENRTREIKEIGNFIHKNAQAGHEPTFLISEEGNDTSIPDEVRLSSSVLKRMINSQTFKVVKSQIRSTNRSSRTKISLCFTRDESFPISGFPQCLHDEKAMVYDRRSAASPSFRWAVRSNSEQQQRRREWIPPNTVPPMEKRDLLDDYASVNHLLGNAGWEVERAPERYNAQGFSLSNDSRYTLPGELAASRSVVELPTDQPSTIYELEG